MFWRSWSSPARMDGKTVLITGANTGIGKGTAKDLAKRGHFLLTYLLINLIKKSAPARIITVSSVAHTWGSINLDDIHSEKSYSKNRAYSQSKLANVLFSHSLAKKLEGTGMTTYALHPGYVQTELVRHLNRTQQVLLKMLSPLTKTPIQGAQTTLFCAVEQSMENVTGKYYSDAALSKCSAKGRDDQLAQKLWDLTCKQLSITWD